MVDDGSTDATARELAALDDPRLTVLRHEHPRGVAAARNHGLEHVNAPWVAFLDDDDVWAPGLLAAVLEAAQSSGVDRERIGLVFSALLVLDGDRELTGVSPAEPAETVRERLPVYNPLGGPSGVVLRTDVVRALGGFDERLSIVADWDLWVRVMREHEAVRQPELLVGYMRHSGSMHLDVPALLGELTSLRRKHGWMPGGLSDVLAEDRFPLYVAVTYRAAGRRVRAARWYLRSARARREPRDLARAVSVLLGERLTDLSGLRQGPTVDASAWTWVARVREAERRSPTGLPALDGARERALR